MGSRDHSITCEVCGLQRGGLNDYKCRCDRRPAIVDPVLMVSVTFGVGPDNKARISWSEGSCLVEPAGLVAGRWVLADDLGCPGKTPPIDVVCRATALAVGAWIKDRVQCALEVP